MKIILVSIIVGLMIVIVKLGLKYKKANDQLQSISKLLNIGKHINKEIKLNKLIENVIEIAKSIVDAQEGILFLVDLQKQEVFTESRMVKMGEGIVGTVASTGKTINIADISKNHEFKKDKKAILTLPIKNNQQTIGVVQLINKKDGTQFTLEDQQLMERVIEFQISPNIEKAQLYEKLRRTFVDSLESMVSVIDAKDIYTQGHCRRVSKRVVKMGKEIGLNEHELEQLEYAGILHDVGKIGIKDAILNKQGPLDDEEFNIMKMHPIIGDNILKQISTLDQSIRDGVKYHHEKYDGTGYCEGLKGKEIPLFARILAIADTYDAITTDRVYREALPIQVALDEIQKGSGTQFDPELVGIFIKVMGKHVTL